MTRRPPESSTGPVVDAAARLARLHLRFGWSALLLFITLGAVLETLHGFKAGFYLNPSNETRRLLWTLAHAHGTLLAIVNIAFALTIRAVAAGPPPRAILASRCLLGASLLLPGGFFLGGTVVLAGDPGLPILLVPLGALLLILAVTLIIRIVFHGSRV